MKTVLLVDDEDDIREVAQMSLEVTAGCEDTGVVDQRVDATRGGQNLVHQRLPLGSAHRAQGLGNLRCLEAVPVLSGLEEAAASLRHLEFLRAEVLVRHLRLARAWRLA